jgi:hypothetical protein
MRGQLSSDWVDLKRVAPLALDSSLFYRASTITGKITISEFDGKIYMTDRFICIFIQNKKMIVFFDWPFPDFYVWLLMMEVISTKKKVLPHIFTFS